MASFTVFLILVTLCPITTMFFCEMLVQLVVRLYAKNDIRADFIKHLLTPSGFYHSGLEDKWKPLANKKYFPSEKDSQAIPNQNKSKYVKIVYLLFGVATVLITVVPGVASWLVSRTSEYKSGYDNCTPVEPGAYAYNQKNTTGFRVIQTPSLEENEYNSINSYIETRFSNLNYENALSISQSKTFNLINMTAYNPGGGVKPNSEQIPYTVDYETVYNNFIGNSGISKTSMGSITETKNSSFHNNTISNFKFNKDLVIRNISLLKEGTYEDTSLFYYEGDSKARCYLTISDKYEISGKMFGMQTISKENFVHPESFNQYDNIINEIKDLYSNRNLPQYITSNGTILSSETDKKSQISNFLSDSSLHLKKSVLIRNTPILFFDYQTGTELLLLTNQIGPLMDTGLRNNAFYFTQVKGSQTAELRCNGRFEYSTAQPTEGTYVFTKNNWAAILEQSTLLYYTDKRMTYDEAFNATGIPFFFEHSVESCLSHTPAYKAKFLTIWVIATSAVAVVLFVALNIVQLKVTAGDMMREILSFKRCDTDLADLITTSDLPSRSLVVGTCYNDMTDMNHMGLVEKDLDGKDIAGKKWY